MLRGNVGRGGALTSSVAGRKGKLQEEEGGCQWWEHRSRGANVWLWWAVASVVCDWMGSAWA